MMDANRETESLSGLLLDWYYAERRILPWREDPTPYHVWISEIMLQQTRVEAVKEYYRRFLEVLPDVRALAEAGEQTYMKLWEGLGYYSRIRNMHKAAVVVMEEYGGRIPGNSKELEKLPGIGAYTAAAIASIAFGEAVPSIDGNLLRVFARMTCCSDDIMKSAAKKQAEAWYKQIIPLDTPGDFNQAVMDLGATVCLPNTEPKCGLCPWADLCESNAAGTEREYPVRIVKTRKSVEKLTVFLIDDGSNIYLRRRPEKGLLAGLYEFPHEPGHLTEKEASERMEAYGFRVQELEKLPAAKHEFSHVTWKMNGYRVFVDKSTELKRFLAASEVWLSGTSAQEKKVRLQEEVSEFAAGTPSFSEPQLIAVERKEMEQEYTIPSAFDAYRKLLK